MYTNEWVIADKVLKKVDGLDNANNDFDRKKILVDDNPYIKPESIAQWFKDSFGSNNTENNYVFCEIKKQNKSDCKKLSELVKIKRP